MPTLSNGPARPAGKGSAWRNRLPCILSVGFFVVVAISGHGGWAGESRQFDIHVEANPTKVGGQPWDGPGAVIIGPFLPDAAGPPDLVACFFDKNGLRRCLTHERDSNRSACHNSLDCDWSAVDVPPDVFGVVILDLDMSQSDFVDAVILVDRSDQKRGAAADQIEAAIRNFITVRAPAFTEGERARRDRPFQRIMLSICEASECVLRQSRLLLERVD